MTPVIALVGRPNVGKSTLFNRLTRTRDALVASYPGLTRDRQYGQGKMGGFEYLVVDTGGLSGDDDGIDEYMALQSLRAIDESDLILFMVDALDGRTAGDEAITQMLREKGANVLLVANKIDGQNPDFALGEFSSLGLGEPMCIAATSGHGVTNMMTELVPPRLPEPGSEAEDPPEDQGIRIAIVGRPNVGKSTLVNRMLGEDRVVVFDEAGTTRDSIYIPFERDEQRYTLIDTAGVRRRGRIHETVEKFSVIKTLDAIKDAHVVLLIVDAQDGLVEQDLHLLGHVLHAGRALVLAVNKWDGLEADQRERIRVELDRRLNFLSFVTTHFISALHGSGVGNLYKTIGRAHESAMRELKTPVINNILNKAVTQHPPPLVNGHRIKLRYAHLGGHNPPIIVIHGNQTQSVPEHYKRYLENQFIKALKLEGTPILIQFKTADNPFKGRKNELSSRQIKKKRRLMKHVKKKR